MLELLIKYVGYNPDLTNEKELHLIVQDMSEFCYPNTKLAKVRDAVKKRTLMDYILDSGMNLWDKEKVKKLRELNAKLDTSPTSDARLSFQIAKKFIEQRHFQEALHYLELSINTNFAKEGVKYLLELLKGGVIADLPPSLVQSAFFSDIEPKQLSDLLSVLPRKAKKPEDLKEYVGQFKASMELGNDVSSIIINQMVEDLPKVNKMVEHVLDDEEIVDSTRQRIVSTISRDVALAKIKGGEEQEVIRREVLEKVEEVKDSLSLLCDIKKSMKSITDEAKERINEKEFIKNQEYRKKIIDTYAKVMIRMNLAKPSLLRHIDANEYATIAISGLFEKSLSLEALIQECDYHIAATKVDPKDLVLNKILPLCTKDEHFLYCIKKIATTANSNKMYNLLVLVKGQGVPIQYFYNFGPTFSPKEPDIPIDHKELIKSLVRPKENSINYLEKQYMAIYQHTSDSTLFIYYALLNNIKSIHCPDIQPLLVFPLWLLKKLDWIRPQVGAKRSKYMRDSVSSAHAWAFSKVSLEAVFGEDLAKVGVELSTYLEKLFGYESRAGPGSLSVGVITKVVHIWLKKKYVSFAQGGRFFLVAELVYQVFKRPELASEREKLCTFIGEEYFSKGSIEVGPLIDYYIKSPLLSPILVSVLRMYPGEIEQVAKVSRHIKNMLDALVDFFTISVKLPNVSLYYQLDALKLNNRLHKIRKEWGAVGLLQKYTQFSKSAFPEAVSPVLRKLWEKDYDKTMKRVIFTLFEEDFKELYGRAAVKNYLVKNAMEQLGTEYKGSFKSVIDVIEFINDYIKSKSEIGADEYCNLLAVGLISAKYIEETNKGKLLLYQTLDESKAVQLVLEVLEKAGYTAIKAEFVMS